MDLLSSHVLKSEYEGAVAIEVDQDIKISCKKFHGSRGMMCVFEKRFLAQNDSLAWQENGF